MTTRLAPIYAAVGLGLAVTAATLAMALRVVDPVPLVETPFGFKDSALVGFECFGLTFAAVGALLVARRPRNAVGWIMVAVGVLHAAAGLGVSITSSLVAAGPASAGVAAVVAWVTFACVILGAVVYELAIVFPTGHGHTPGWNRFARLFPLGLLAAAALYLTQPGPLLTVPTITNPFGIGSERSIAGFPLSQLIVPIAVLFTPVFAWAIVDRYRVSDDLVRRQLKWFILSMLVAMSALGVTLVAPMFTSRAPEIGLAVFGFAGALVAIAIGIAILRHGLYDIDRLISRTLGYGVITAVLAAVFVISVVTLSAVLGNLADGNSFAVALSTLIVAALFGPLRRRAQATIDRHFDRSGYDAARTATEFSDRLRDEVDLATVTTDLRDTVRVSVRPERLGIWLRGAGR